MKTSFQVAGLLLFLSSLSQAQDTTSTPADSYVYVNVSFKILVPSQGNPNPCKYQVVGLPNPDEPSFANGVADFMLREINQSMDNNKRGLRYRRLGDVEFVHAEAVGDSNDADTANDVDDLFRRVDANNAYIEDVPAWRSRMPIYTLLDIAPLRPVPWKFRADAANFYLLSNWPGGVGDFTDNVLAQGDFDVDPGAHEFGHWFSLVHTFASAEFSTPEPAIGYAIQWGDDGYSDTLLDHHYGSHTLNSLSEKRGYGGSYAPLMAPQKQQVDADFRLHYSKQFYNSTYASLTTQQKSVIDSYRTNDEIANNSFARDGELQRDLIATGNFGSPGAPAFYFSLSATNQERVRAAVMNTESYRFGKGSVEGYFSEQQNDRICDVISQPIGTRDRSYTRGGEFGNYWFFGGPTLDFGAPLGTSRNPRSSLANAHASADPAKKSIIIGRPGSYAINGNPVTLNKPVTLRATRAGAFTIH